MEYVFGNIRKNNRYIEIVKTINNTHTDLKGFCHIERAYSDNIITDEFRVVDHYHADENSEKCFDWYEIDHHNRIMDKFTPAKPAIDKGITDNEDAVCELSETTEDSIAALEQAICDLSEEIGG